MATVPAASTTMPVTYRVSGAFSVTGLRRLGATSSHGYKRGYVIPYRDNKPAAAISSKIPPRHLCCGATDGVRYFCVR